jgi:hypothetical protein
MLFLPVAAVVVDRISGSRSRRRDKKIKDAEAAARIREIKANAPRTFQEMLERWMRERDK